jgi:hypothetical protein
MFFSIAIYNGEVPNNIKSWTDEQRKVVNSAGYKYTLLTDLSWMNEGEVNSYNHGVEAIKRFYDRKNYSEERYWKSVLTVSTDLIRYIYLIKNGGIYIDADTSLSVSMAKKMALIYDEIFDDEISLAQETLFAHSAIDRPFNNGVIIAPKGSKCIKKLLAGLLSKCDDLSCNSIWGSSQLNVLSLKEIIPMTKTITDLINPFLESPDRPEDDVLHFIVHEDNKLLTQWSVIKNNADYRILDNIWKFISNNAKAGRYIYDKIADKILVDTTYYRSKF